MVPWDQIFFWPKFPIKLLDFFILCTFHESKLFWLHHATFNPKWNSLCGTVCSLTVYYWIARRAVIANQFFYELLLTVPVPIKNSLGAQF